MTNTTSTQSLSLDTVLAHHNYASVDDAREDNIFRACGGCGTIMACTPAPNQTREQQAKMLRDNYDLDCCPDADDYYF